MASFLSSFSVLNVALNAIGFILKNKSVTIYDSSNQEVLESCSIISCVVQDKSRLMEHPLEMGAKVVDHKVFEPIAITLQIALPVSFYEDQYQQIVQMYKDCEMLSVQTKAQIYSNLQIAAIPHEEKAETIDRLIFNLELREAQIASDVFVTQYSPVRNKEDSKTVNIGQTQGKKSSILYNQLGSGKLVGAIRSLI